MEITRTITTDPRPQLTAAGDGVATIVDRVRPGHLALPTPCPEMDVAELFSHMMMAIARAAAAGRGDELSTWAVEGPDLPLEEWSSAWREATEHAVSAWATDDGRLDAEIRLPWTTLSGADVVAIYTNEVVVHGWELAVAIGTSAAWSDDVIEVASAAIHGELPDADRGPMWAAVAAQMPEGITWSDPFANAVEVGEDASNLERLVAWNGRDPGWSAV